MDYFGREELKELLEAPGGRAVSMYVRTRRTSSEAETNRLRFRAAVDEARDRISSDGAEADPDGVLDPAVDLLNEEDFWRYQSDGFAAFAAPGFFRTYRLATELPNLVVVGPSFHTRPMMEYLQAPDRYWVLGLSQKSVRLWEGTKSGLTPVDLTNLPRDLLDALEYEFERDNQFLHRRKPTAKRRSGGRGSGGGWTPVFHGHGVGVNDSEPELKQFFRKVDAALHEYLSDEIGPVILAAVKEYHSIYRSVSGLERLSEEGVEGNVLDWSEERVHEAAWPIARRTVLDKIDQALRLWENAFKSGKGERDLASVAHLAVQGRIRLLLSEAGRRFWGHLDETSGDVELLREGGDDPGPEAVDLANAVAEVVIRHGGRTLVLPGDRMPTDTGVAAVLW